MPDYDTAVATAISAGIDMVMVPYDGPRFQAAVQAGLANGKIEPSRIDDAVTRILTVKFELGLFEHPMPAEDDAQLGSEHDRTLAREAVGKSAVLLKTTAGLLPLATGDDVLLAGSGADDIGTQSGGWTITWQGSAGPTTPGTTIADDLRARLGDHLIYTGVRAIPAGTHAKTGIVVVAEPPYAEGKGDSATLALPADDLATIAQVRPMVDRLVVVVLSGRPVMLDAILPARRRGRRGLAARHRGRRRRGRPLRGSAVHGDHAVHLAEDAERRPADRQGRVRWRGLPAGLRPERGRVAARPGGLPGVLTAVPRPDAARRRHAPLMQVWAMVPA